MSENGATGANMNERFPPEFVTGVASEFGIPEEQIERFRSVLMQAVRIYFLSQAAPTWEEQLLAIRRALESVERRYLEFSKALALLPHRAQDRLWHPLFENPDRPPGFKGLAEPFGPVVYADEKSFFELLGTFGKRIRVRLDDLPVMKKRGGRPRLTALRHWVDMVGEFWANELGRDFRYSEAGGKPKSDAYDFCMRLLPRLDPSVTPQQLITAFKSAVKPFELTITVHPSIMADDKPR